MAFWSLKVHIGFFTFVIKLILKIFCLVTDLINKILFGAMFSEFYLFFYSGKVLY